jgi:hypothetical protein
MPLAGLKPTSSSPERQHFSAGRGTDSGAVTDPGKAGDSKEDRSRSFSIRVVKDRELNVASFKWLKEESVEDADVLPEQEELAMDAIAELEGAVEELHPWVLVFRASRPLARPAALEPITNPKKRSIAAG